LEKFVEHRAMIDGGRLHNNIKPTKEGKSKKLFKYNLWNVKILYSFEVQKLCIIVEGKILHLQVFNHHNKTFVTIDD
jgi:hypothetical protein